MTDQRRVQCALRRTHLLAQRRHLLSLHVSASQLNDPISRMPWPPRRAAAPRSPQARRPAPAPAKSAQVRNESMRRAIKILPCRRRRQAGRRCAARGGRSGACRPSAARTQPRWPPQRRSGSRRSCICESIDGHVVGRHLRIILSRAGRVLAPVMQLQPHAGSARTRHGCGTGPAPPARAASPPQVQPHSTAAGARRAATTWIGGLWRAR